MNTKDEDFLVEVEVNTNMCECLDQWVVTEVCNKCNKLRYRVNAELRPEHYGPYGENCMNTGQFDAGECWMCYARRKKREAEDAKAWGFEQAVLKNQAYTEITALQLIASRHQYLFNHAQRFINKIDKLFVYPFLGFDLDALQKKVREHLVTYTEAVSKVKRRSNAIPRATKDSKKPKSREV